MAFRGAIAVSKGFKIQKLSTSQKEERVQRWQKNYSRQATLFSQKIDSTDVAVPNGSTATVPQNPLYMHSEELTRTIGKMRTEDLGMLPAVDEEKKFRRMNSLA